MNETRDIIVVSLAVIPVCWALAFILHESPGGQFAAGIVLGPLLAFMALSAAMGAGNVVGDGGGGGGGYVVLFLILYSPFWIGSAFLNTLLANLVMMYLKKEKS